MRLAYVQQQSTINTDQENTSSIFNELAGVNAERQFKQARDTQRRADLLAIANVAYQYASEHDGILPDTDGDEKIYSFPETETCIGSYINCFDLGIAGDDIIVVPTYIAGIPYDPLNGSPENTHYTIHMNTEGR